MPAIVKSNSMQLFCRVEHGVMFGVTPKPDRDSLAKRNGGNGA